jgi:AraC-like DNA-binding protein
MDNMKNSLANESRPDFERDSTGIERNLQLIKHLNLLKLELLDHGYFIGDLKWNQFGVFSPFGRLYYMIDDHGWLETDHGKIDLLPGKMYLIPPYTKVNLRTARRIEKFYFHFSLRYASYEILEGIQTCFELPLDPGRLKRIILSYQSGQLPDLLELKGLAYETLAGFIRFSLPDLSSRILLAGEYQPVYEYVEKNLSARLNARLVSEAVDIPYETLRRSFRRDHGLTLNQYIQGRLIQRSSVMLLMTQMNISEIAAAMGFSDEFYFSRLFKQKMQFSPREYRRINAVLRTTENSFQQSRLNDRL